MKNTNKTNRIARTLTAAMAAVMMMTAAASVTASADTSAVASMSVSTAASKSGGYFYHGKKVIEGHYKVDGSGNYSFKYSDGFFKVDPRQYDPHMATMSCALAHASCTNVIDGDYSKGAEDVESILTQAGFKDFFANDDYLKKPTADSVGCAIANKTVDLGNTEKRIISVTIRSANYGAEWVSNVTLGKSGEAKGFSDSAIKVLDCIGDYITAHPETAKDVSEGRASFWFQGFSRGGAVANLAAKKAIDHYTVKYGCTVYAYCIEAPQGGIAAAEDQSCDYSSIHNIINPDDIVPYVAPTGMGFKRYGVDHYLNGTDAGEIKNSTLFKNNLCDNSYEKSVSEERLALVKKHIAGMAGANNVSEHAPYAAENKKFEINISERSADIKNAGGSVITSELIKNTFDDVCKKISRNDYVNKKYEDAVRHLMIFNQTGGGLRSLQNVLDLKSLGISVVKDVYTPSGIVGIVMAVFPWTAPALTPVLIRTADLTISDFLASAKKILGEDAKLRTALKNYPGGADQALNDIHSLASAVIPTFKNLNAMVTFGVNAAELIKNHSSIQTCAWLRSYDSWFEDSLEDSSTVYEIPVCTGGITIPFDWNSFGCTYGS